MGRIGIRKQMVRAFDENVPREMASQNSHMVPTGRKEEVMT
jgi:hypothetical protein